MNERDRAKGVMVGVLALGLALADTSEDRGRWRTNGACREVDPTVFDGETRATREQARRICSACPLQQQCANEQLTWEAAYPAASRYLHGVVGGLTTTDRFLIHHPDYRERRRPADVSTLDSKAA